VSWGLWRLHREQVNWRIMEKNENWFWKLLCQWFA